MDEWWLRASQSAQRMTGNLPSLEHRLPADPAANVTHLAPADAGGARFFRLVHEVEKNATFWTDFE